MKFLSGEFEDFFFSKYELTHGPGCNIDPLFDKYNKEGFFCFSGQRRRRRIVPLLLLCDLSSSYQHFDEKEPRVQMNGDTRPHQLLGKGTSHHNLEAASVMP